MTLAELEALPPVQRRDTIGRPGQRADGTMFPALLTVDGKVLCGYDTERAARKDADLYMRASKKGKRWALEWQGKETRLG